MTVWPDKMRFLTLGADMARPSRTGGKASEAKARNASAAKGRKTTKTKRRIVPAAARAKRRPVAGPRQDLKEAREQQAATAEILKVIASSPGDVQPVLQALAISALRLCEALSATILLRDEEVLIPSAHVGPLLAPLGERQPLHRGWVAGRAVLERVTIHVPDLLEMSESEYPLGKAMALKYGHRATLAVPLIREGWAIGTILVRRRDPRPFSGRQIALLETFADQAVIALGNVRLFEEVQAKTRDLSEALQQQTATADVLKVISRSAFDLQKVLNTLVESAADLIGTTNCTLCVREGEIFPFRAMLHSESEWGSFLRANPARPGRQSVSGRVLLSGDVETIRDVQEDSEYLLDYRLEGYRSLLGVPLLRDGKVEGVFTLSRPVVGEFTARQVDLARTFADQAMIAIENARLFSEVQARTRDLSEALTYQTGSANILKVIASSPTDVGPVLNAIVESACELCDSNDAAVLLKDGDDLRFRAHHGPIDINVEKWPINRRWTAGRAFLDGEPVHLRDAWSEEGKEFPDSKALSNATNSADIRTVLSVPLMRDNDRVGAIVLRRTEVRPFSDKQINLLKMFADQAVIAIGNVHMFEQVQARTRDLTESLEQQTATSEVLEVISTSPGELEPVFRKMLENATRVCGANFGMMQLWNGETFSTAAAYNVPPAFAALREGKPIHVHHPQSGLSIVLESHQVVHIHDVTKGAAYLGGDPNVVQLADIGGARTVVLVPMLKEDEFIGTFTIYRQEVRPFTDKQIALVENFTKQAVIAIENTRLLRELRERTDDLSTSLDELRTAQDRLIQTEKLASLGQLTAGIAHEIKNPLNFVNNFSALSAELTDELNDALKPVAMDGKIRQEVDELTGLLKDNLEKVVQHGKRADSIVKNMLLHSREGSREHRPADINSLLDESLNLAYHGARAEKGEFNITLQRDFDADVGTIEVFPQEITRAFLNLIANGVYAATRRKTQDIEPGFEPTLHACTKNLGTAVEIRIRDNGTGIPPDVREKMFNPFFTTKPAGEGTGLGLSMTHDIIVKQHGGRIDVATEPGQFTEFTIVLPRKSNLSDKDRGKT
jgi:GAF domain-containing protein